MFVGSYYVNTLDGVMPRVRDTDLLKTRDSLGEYLLLQATYGSNNEQLICSVKGHELAKKRKFKDEFKEELQISRKKKLYDGVQFSDLIDKPLGSVPSIMFWNDQLRDRSTMNSQKLLKGLCHSGKTLLLEAAAQTLAQRENTTEAFIMALGGTKD